MSAGWLWPEFNDMVNYLSQRAVENAAAGTVKPELDELRRRAQAVAIEARACASRTEMERRVPAATIAALRDAGLFRVLQPARFGGFEHSFGALIDLVSDIGEGCASTAWCYGLGAGHQWLIGCFPAAAQQDVWGADPDALVCGSYGPVTKAIAVQGGYRIKGKWGFASNCDNSAWFMAGGFLPTPTPSAGFFLIPMSDVELEDNWYTVGLAGTGSKNVIIRDEIFVPEHRVLTFAQASSASPPGTEINTDPLFRAPFLSVLPIAIGSSAIGAARGALKEFLELTAGRAMRGGIGGAGSKVRELQSIQMRVAEAAAAIDAADLMMRKGITEVERINGRGAQVPRELRIRNRRDQAFAVRLACQSVNTLFEAVGGGGLFTSNGIQRAWRDANAAAKHFGLNWDNAATMYGQHELGLDPGINF